MSESIAPQELDPHDDRVARDLIVELVRIQSYSREEATATEWLVSQMDALGYGRAFVDDAGNAVGIKENPADSGECSETIALLGHIDTVPGDIPVRVEQGVLHGRGSVDAKGSLATFVVAGARYRLKPGQRLVVIGAVEEESTTSKGARFAATQYQPDWCVIGEPSSADAVTLGYKGRLQVEAIFSQPSAHTAGPQTAVAEKAVAWWLKLKSWADKFNQSRKTIFSQLQISLSHFHTDADGMVERAVARAGLRLPVDFPFAEFEASATQALAYDDPSLPVESEIRFFGHEVAHQEPRTSILVNRFNRVFRQLGLKPRHKLKTGTSDMNVVGPVWKCPIVAYGPGDSALDHTPHEHLALDEFTRAIQFLQAVLELD